MAIVPFRKGGANVPIADGGTNADTAADARTNLGTVGVILKNTTPVGTGRTGVNFIEGTGITLTVLDDAGNNRVNVTIDAAAGFTSFVAASTTGSSGGTSLTVNPAATPAAVFVGGLIGPGPNFMANVGIGLGVATSLQWNSHNSTTTIGGNLAAGEMMVSSALANTWRITTFSSSNVTISRLGGGTDTFQLDAVGLGPRMLVLAAS